MAKTIPENKVVVLIDEKIIKKSKFLGS